MFYLKLDLNVFRFMIFMEDPPTPRCARSWLMQFSISAWPQAISAIRLAQGPNAKIGVSDRLFLTK